MAIHYPQRMADESLLVSVPDYLTRGDKVFLLLPEAVSALEVLYKKALERNIRLVVISAYRNFQYQKDLFEDAERRYGVGNGSTWVAPPGHSEHHTGLVVDLSDYQFPEYDDEPGFETTPASAWLLEHAPDFGFHLSFPKGNPQGVGYEPWHWRYVGSVAK